MNARKIKRQGALTLGEMVCGDLPELLEGGVALERRRDVLGTLITDAVGTHTASESQKDTSGGADGRKTASSSVLQKGEGRVRLQALRNVLGALGTKTTKKERTMMVSEALAEIYSATA